METAMIFGTAFVVGFSGAMVPGPLLTFTVSETVRRGFVAGPMIILGHAILELTLVIALVAGFSAYLQQESVFTLIAVVGGAFLLYMGFGMIKDAWNGDIVTALPGMDNNQTGEIASVIENDFTRSNSISASPDNDAGNQNGVRRSLHPIAGGLLISLANPYWSIWWISVGLSYITLALKSGLLGVTSFFSGHILADLTWYCLVAAAVAGGRKFLNDSVYRIILIGCGIFLLVLGGCFIYMGVCKSV
ncbi:MAG: LysE family transporter [Syntrophomonas sp.]